jgi:hypothetical protein
MNRPDKASNDDGDSHDTFVLIDTQHPEISNTAVPEGQVRRADRPLPGNRQSAFESGSRQGGSDIGSEGGAPGPESSSGL